MEYLGDGLGCQQIGLCRAGRGLFCAYAYLLGVTGAAFLHDWKPTDTTVVIAVPTDAITTATFDAVGDYTLRLTVGADRAGSGASPSTGSCA